LVGRLAVGEAGVVLEVDAAGPRLVGEGRVGHHEVEGLELAALLEIRVGQGVVVPELGRGGVVHDDVHAGHGEGGVVLLLAVERQVEPGAAAGLVVGAQQQGAGATRGIVDGLGALGGLPHADDLGDDPRHLARGIELALALARLLAKWRIRYS
jgi:hypothetical protein